MSKIVQNGNSVDVAVQAGQSLKIAWLGGTYTATAVSGGLPNLPAVQGTANSGADQTLGPYTNPVVIRIRASAIGAFSYDSGSVLAFRPPGQSFVRQDDGVPVVLSGIGAAAAFVVGGGGGGSATTTVGPNVSSARPFASSDSNTVVPLTTADLVMTIPLGLAGATLNSLFSCVVALNGTPGFTFPSGVTVNGVAGPSTLYRAASAGVMVSLTQIAANVFLLNGVDTTAPSDPDFAAFMARVTANSGTVSTATQNAYKTLIASLKAAGVVNATDIPRLNMVAGNEQAASLVPLIINGQFTTGAADTATNGSYSEAQGWGTNGTTTFYNTGYVPSTSTGNLGFYSGIANGDSSIHDFMGCADAGNTQQYLLQVNVNAVGNNAFNGTRSHWGGAYAVSSPVATPNGVDAAWWCGGRTGTTASSLYKNGVSAATSATSATPATNSLPVYVMASNNNSTAANPLTSIMKCRGYGIFGALDATKQQAIYNAIQAFNTTLGRQV